MFGVFRCLELREKSLIFFTNPRTFRSFALQFCFLATTSRGVDAKERKVPIKRLFCKKKGNRLCFRVGEKSLLRHIAETFVVPAKSNLPL